MWAKLHLLCNRALGNRHHRIEQKMKHTLLVLFLIIGMTSFAQAPKHAVKKISSHTQYVGGNDMGQEIVSTFSREGVMLSSVKRGFGPGGVVEYDMMPKSQNIQHRWNEEHDEDSVFIDGLLRYRFFIDLDGDTLQSHYYNTNGQRSSTFFIFSKPHRHSVSIAYNFSKEGNLTNRTIYLYNKKNQTTKVQRFSPDEALQYIMTYKYDKHNNCIKQTTTHYNEGRKTGTNTNEHHYTYDPFGNWTECQYLVDGKHYYTIKREIEYW